MPTNRLPLCVRRTYRGDELQAVLDRQERRPDNRRTAEAITGRAAIHHGTTPAQVVAYLRDEERGERS